VAFSAKPASAPSKAHKTERPTPAPPRVGLSAPPCPAAPVGPLALAVGGPSVGGWPGGERWPAVRHRQPGLPLAITRAAAQGRRDPGARAGDGGAAAPDRGLPRPPAAQRSGSRSRSPPHQRGRLQAKANQVRRKERRAQGPAQARQSGGARPVARRRSPPAAAAGPHRAAGAAQPGLAGGIAPRRRYRPKPSPSRNGCSGAAAARPGATTAVAAAGGSPRC